ncbi:MAG: hypothetical protein COA94_06075 [Rickettsiales bacterium]|nr:MAG: hypothetical protein COA94_06075 [Rickettsiales bacterium]
MSGSERQARPRSTSADWDQLKAALKSPSEPIRPVSAELFYREVPKLRAEDLRLAQVPRPPKISLGTVSNTHAVECALWLKAWIYQHYGTAIRWTRRTRFDKRRNWKAMADGIVLLQKHHISAPRWISFVSQMPVVTESVTAPSCAQIFSRGIVTSQLDYCRRASTELGGRTVMTPAARKLAHDHSMMVQDLRLTRASEPPAIRAIVARYFPGGSFARRVATVAAEADHEREGMSKALTEVTWIW